MACWLQALALMAWVGLTGLGQAQAAQRPDCPDDKPQCRAKHGDGLNEYTYIIDGVELRLEFTDGGYYLFTCSGNLTLDNTALPRFKSTLRFKNIHIVNCPPPRGSYAHVFGNLNMRALDKIKLIGAGNLTAAHLGGLGDVLALELVGARLAPGALSALPRLRRLALDRVRLPPGELLRLPRALQALQLVRMGADVSRDMLDALPSLVNVTVRDSHNVSVELGSSLEVVWLETPAVRVPSTLTPALRFLSLNGWAEARPAPWAACALETLDVRFVMAEELPAGWVGACAELRVLYVQNAAQLRALHETALRGARQLRELTLSSTALAELPPGLLDDAEKLSLLDLSGNRLEALPGGLFVRTKYLQTLNLSKNRLTTDVYWSLSAVTSLTVLDLSFNDLKDSCGGANDTVRGSSPLQELKQLTKLKLKRTNTSLICRDWRETMPLLTELDLARNSFISVTYTDLLFRGSGANVKVNLSGNDISTLEYSRADYERVLAGSASRAIVELGGALACDCGAYWAARALRSRPAHVALQAECAGGGALGARRPDALLCGAPELCAAAPRCACAWRPGSRARVLRVTCERAGLTRVRDALAPLLAAARGNRVAPDDYDWQLHLAHNRIADLSVADFPKHLSVLDLTNNSLSTLSERDARALLADDARRVQLAGNPLRCDCAAAPALAVLQARQAGLADYSAVTCAGGARLAAQRVAPCPALGAGAVGALAALAALLGAGALGGLLAPRSLRLRLKAALHRRGWLPAAREDDALRFDVFVSFSHGDERFVRDELVARLESGPAPYRLCVHYRDWAPGGWIPAQIAASVRASRRTVAVVSEHFLRSAWARAEFQEAYALALRDARPRLVVVLLGEPAALPLDDKLRRYLATNTYVRWGDPWFWEKLRLALPRGRGPAPPGAEPSGTAAASESAAPELPEAEAASDETAPAPATTMPVPAKATPAPSVEVKVCLEPSAVSSPNASECSSSSSPTCSSSSTDESVELTRLMAASCGALACGERTLAPCPSSACV